MPLTARLPQSQRPPVVTAKAVASWRTWRFRKSMTGSGSSNSEEQLLLVAPAGHAIRINRYFEEIAELEKSGSRLEDLDVLRTWGLRPKLIAKAYPISFQLTDDFIAEIAGRCPARFAPFPIQV